MRTSAAVLGFSILSAVITGVATSAGSASAQAWVPMPGQGNIAFGYQYTIIHDHLFSVNMEGVVTPRGYPGGPGNHIHLGNISGLSGALSADYGVVAGLAVSASTAIVTTLYTGRAIEGSYDDGQYHTNFQDLILGMRYMARWNMVAITPMVGAQIPLVDYVDFGHAATGSGLHQYPVGIAVGAPLIQNAYLQAAYARVLVVDVDEFNLDRNSYRVQGGYFITPALSASGFFSYSESVDGVDWARDLSTPSRRAEHFGHHDVAAKALVRRAGGSVGFGFTPRLGLHIAYDGTLSGSNAHSSQGATLGLNWGFSTRARFAR